MAQKVGKATKKKLKRDADYRCAYCNKQSLSCTLDHVFPTSLGGDNTLNNIAVCCEQCNLLKGDMLLTDFIKKYNVKITPKIAKFL